jgi:hypothetical protein
VDLKSRLETEPTGFLGLCSCLLGSKGTLSLASQVMGPSLLAGLPWAAGSMQGVQGRVKAAVKQEKAELFLVHG